MCSYEFTLPEPFRVLAREELREDDDVRQQSLVQLREWIGKNPHIKKCRTDDIFLLKFLRFRKFSVHQAGEAIERYLVARQKLTEWLQNMDPLDVPLAEIQEDGPVVDLGRDGTGRTVVLLRIQRYNVEKVTQHLMVRHLLMLLEVLTEQEEVQIGGFRVWIDFTNMPLKFVALINLSDVNPIMDLLTKTMPIRIREIHAAKLPKFAVAIANLAMSFASQKLKSRITCHATVLEAKKHMPETLWPEEFGGSVDVEQLNRRMRKQLEERRDSLLALDSDLEIDTTHYSAMWQRNGSASEAEIESGMVGTFRKLNVD